MPHARAVLASLLILVWMAPTAAALGLGVHEILDHGAADHARDHAHGHDHVHDHAHDHGEAAGPGQEVRTPGPHHHHDHELPVDDREFVSAAGPAGKHAPPAAVSLPVRDAAVAAGTALRADRSPRSAAGTDPLVIRLCRLLN